METNRMVSHRIRKIPLKVLGSIMRKECLENETPRAYQVQAQARKTVNNVINELGDMDNKTDWEWWETKHAKCCKLYNAVDWKIAQGLDGCGIPINKSIRFGPGLSYQSESQIPRNISVLKIDGFFGLY